MLQSNSQNYVPNVVLRQHNLVITSVLDNTASALGDNNSFVIDDCKLCYSVRLKIIQWEARTIIPNLDIPNIRFFSVWGGRWG